MTTEKTEKEQGHKEKCTTTSCCTPLNFVEMMAKFGTDSPCECITLMQEMMKGGCCQPEQK